MASNPYVNKVVYDSNTLIDISDTTATATDVLSGTDFYSAAGAKTNGRMTDNGAVSQVLDTSTTSYTIPEGYHNGSGTVSIVAVEGSTITPTTSYQRVTPSSGQVFKSEIVNPIPDNYGDATNVTVTAATLASGYTAIGWDSDNNQATTIIGTATIGDLSGTIYTTGGSSTASGTTCSKTISIPTGAIVLGAFGYSSGGQNSYRRFRATDSDGNTQSWAYNTSYSDGGYTYTNGVYSWCPYFDSTWKDKEITELYCYARADSSTTLRVAVSAVYLIPD